MALANNGQVCASGARDTSVRIWDVAAEKQVWKVSKAQNVVTCMKWYPSSDGAAGAGAAQSILLQGSEDLRVRMWDTRAGLKEVKVLDGYVYFPVSGGG